jgi:large subunit ribosomal protein L7/L12
MADKKDEKKDTKVSKNVEKLVEEVSKLSVMELSELVNALQEKLGVSAAPVAAAPAATPVGEGETKAEEGGGSANQTVIMTGIGDNKIGIIKALREVDQNLTLMDAKGMTENLPAEILKDAKAEDAKAAADKLKAAGATVELK